MQSLSSKDFGSDALIQRYFSSAQCFTHLTLTSQVDDNRMTGSLLALGVLNATSSGCCCGAWTEQFWSDKSERQLFFRELRIELLDRSPDDEDARIQQLAFRQRLESAKCPYGSTLPMDVTWPIVPEDIAMMVEPITFLKILAVIYGYLPLLPVATAHRGVSGVMIRAVEGARIADSRVFHLSFRWGLEIRPSRGAEARGCQRCKLCAAALLLNSETTLASMCKVRMPFLKMDLITRSDLILNGLMANSIFFASVEVAFVLLDSAINRETRHLWILLWLGFLLCVNEGIVKKLVAEPRPGSMMELRGRNGLLEGSCVEKCGMPSSHAAISMGWFTLSVLDAVSKTDTSRDNIDDTGASRDVLVAEQRKWGDFIRNFCWIPWVEKTDLTVREFISIVLYWCLLLVPVPFMRVVLRDHTERQVFAGCILGMTLAMVWWRVLRVLERRYHITLRGQPRQATPRRPTEVEMGAP
eukprot:s552_g26.t2